MEKSSEISLQTAEAIREQDQSQRAILLLTGIHGPLSGTSAAFSDDVAGLAYCLRLAWRLARKQDQYSKLAVYEARERFGARVRSEASASGSIGEFFVRLLRKLGTNLDQLQARDLFWYLTWKATAPVSLLRDRVTMEETLSAAQLVDGWLFEVSKLLYADDPVVDAEDSAAVELVKSEKEFGNDPF